MNLQSGIRILLVHTSVFGFGALVAVSCLQMDLPTVAYRCNPRQANNCPDTHFCCSDDPAAVGDGIPEYLGKEYNGATPIFSGRNNGLGTSGMCVRRSDVPAGYGLLDPGAQDCPVPCNPTWDRRDIDDVCGEGWKCCQTVELDPKDCIYVGESWRPAKGTDYRPDGNGDTNWAPGEHATHQDPGLAGCTQWGVQNDENDCIDQLTVADQRGFCMFLGDKQCGTDREGYLDACEILNLDPGV